MRKFDSGATRDDDYLKIDYEGILHPLVVEAYGEYMTEHRKQADGTIRDADNWQKGMPKPVYMKSLLRHVFDLWAIHRGIKRFDKRDNHEITIKEACSAILFNCMGYLYESLDK